MTRQTGAVENMSMTRDVNGHVATTIIREALAAVLLLLPVSGGAQSLTAGSLVGSVRDPSGAVMPGVTVEAASPALIEKVRTAVTDEHGEYKITELRPGTYSVSFSLVGFATIKRDGIELGTGFAATVNAELRVGSIEETVTVTGASPLVDVQNARTNATIGRQAMETLPSGRVLQSFAALTLGLSTNTTQDVGGAAGEGIPALTIRGGRGADSHTVLDGMLYNDGIGTASGFLHTFVVDQNAIQEVVLETGGQSAEVETGGVNINHVPKDGGDEFHGYFLANGTNSHFVASNLTPGLVARGVTSSPGIVHAYDVGGTLGGPIKRAKLWFFTAQRVWDGALATPGIYFNQTQHTIFYTPDLNRPGYADNYSLAHTFRVTWQAAAKHKFNATVTEEGNCLCLYGAGGTLGGNNAPEAAVNQDVAGTWLPQITWDYALSNRMLFSVGATYCKCYWKTRPVEGVVPTDISVLNSATGLQYNAATSYTYNPQGPFDDQANGRASMSYVTGSHAFKFGATWVWGAYIQRQNGSQPLPLQYVVSQPTPASPLVPQRVVQYAYPNHNEADGLDTGVYAQDQWTINHLTLNVGLRWDRLYGWDPAQTRPAGPFSPAIDISRIENVPNWNALRPRIGAAYDLFGNGKTSVKGFWGTFSQGELNSIGGAVNPASSVAVSATRTWNDMNGNYVPDCNLFNNLANGECGADNPITFGQSIVTTRYDPAILSGWNVRPSTGQAYVEVQHELRTGLSARAGYYRTAYYNFFVTQNLALSPSDFDSYCITVPSDPRLTGGGNHICGLYDVKPDAFLRAPNNLVTSSNNFRGGGATQVYNGFEVQVSARFGHGGTIASGLSSGQTVWDSCFVVDNPQSNIGSLQTAPFAQTGLYQCHQTNPWKGQTQIKINGNYPLPWWGVQVSVVYQDLPGVPIQAAAVIGNAAIAPGLGRNLGQCGAAAVCNGTATVNLLTPFTEFEDRLRQLDARFAKNFRVGRVRYQAMLETYNLFNSNTVLTRSNSYTSSTGAWGRPTAILLPRMFKIGAQITFLERR